jgi:hypothetical protein
MTHLAGWLLLQVRPVLPGDADGSVTTLMVSAWQWPALRALAHNAVALQGGLDAVNVRSRRGDRNVYCQDLPSYIIDGNQLDRLRSLPDFLQRVNPTHGDTWWVYVVLAGSCMGLVARCASR